VDPRGASSWRPRPDRRSLRRVCLRLGDSDGDHSDGHVNDVNQDHSDGDGDHSDGDGDHSDGDSYHGAGKRIQWSWLGAGLLDGLLGNRGCVCACVGLSLSQPTAGTSQCMIFAGGTSSGTVVDRQDRNRRGVLVGILAVAGQSNPCSHAVPNIDGIACDGQADF